MAYTAGLPTWNKAGVAPNATKQNAGWGVDENPPADWFNWQWNLTFKALQELQQKAANIDGSLSFTGQIKSAVAVGTAPLVVVSTTKVANLNADMVDDMHAATAATVSTLAARDASGDITARRFVSALATGTAPLQVASTTKVANFNADLLDDMHATNTMGGNTVVARDASGDMLARVGIFGAAQGTAPFTITSTTMVANLNVDTVDGYHMDQDTRKAAAPTFAGLTLVQAAGIAPLTVTSDTKVDNLNADMVDGQHIDSGATANTVASRDANGDLTARRFGSSVAQGTAPFFVTSTTMVANLNADTVDGYHMNQDVRTTASPTFAKVTAATLASTVATGTAPMSVASQTVVTNLNADLLDGKHAQVLDGVGTIPIRHETSGFIHANGFVSANASGAPFVVNSSAMVANLNADMVDGMHATATNVPNTIVARSVNGDFDARVIAAYAATGTPPIVVNSTTRVANLNADLLDGMHSYELVQRAGWNEISAPIILNRKGQLATYGGGGLMIQSDDGTYATLGFHRSGFTAVSLTHDANGGLSLFNSTGSDYAAFYAHMVAAVNYSYTSRYVRNTIISTVDPSGGNPGDLWVKYTP